MRLGDAIQKRRGRSGGSSRRAPEPSPERRPAGARFAGWLFGLTLAGLAIGYLVATRFLFPAPPPPRDLVEVPRLHGLPLDRARERVLAAGLDLGPADGIRHPGLDSGVVVGQAPLPGQLARRGEAVRFTVSMGPLRQPVPDVAPMPADRAVRVLEASGFRVSVDSAEAEEPTGTILAVEPAVGTVLRVPGDVRLSVSRGPAMVPMPFLLGMPEQAAIDSLRMLSIGVAAVDTVFRFGRDQGLVVEQDPPADSLVRRGGAVRLSVGREGGR